MAGRPPKPTKLHILEGSLDARRHSNRADVLYGDDAPEQIRGLGKDGLTAWRELMPRIGQRLSPGGTALLEIGQGQEHDIAALADAHRLSVGEVWRDLAGIFRVMEINNHNK